MNSLEMGKMKGYQGIYRELYEYMYIGCLGVVSINSVCHESSKWELSFQLNSKIQKFKCKIEIWEKEKNHKIGTCLVID